MNEKSLYILNDMILNVPIGFGNRNTLTHLTYNTEIVTFKQTLLHY